MYQKEICTTKGSLRYLEDGVQDELGEGAGQFLSIRAICRLAEFTGGWVKIPGKAAENE